MAHLPLFIWHYLVASNHEWKMGLIFVVFSGYSNFTNNLKVHKKSFKIKADSSTFLKLKPIARKRQIRHKRVSNIHHSSYWNTICHLKGIYWALNIRVANVVADHNSLLRQWRPIKMSKFRAKIFLIRTTSNYFWASEVLKNQRFKSHLFSFSQ